MIYGPPEDIDPPENLEDDIPCIAHLSMALSAV
jgi:hypothetical protein